MDYKNYIEKTKIYIDEHLSENIDAEKIASNAGYSLYHFCRVFKEYTGESLMTYVREKRLDIAREEIEKGRAATDVAMECGFETSSGFARAYMRKFGERPTKRMHA